MKRFRLSNIQGYMREIVASVLIRIACVFFVAGLWVSSTRISRAVNGSNEVK